MVTLDHSSYWLTEPLITGQDSLPDSGEIVIIGSGLSGVSTAYWLQKMGFNDLTLVDFEPEKSASFRNCGHILHGSVESAKALCTLHGFTTAKQIWEFSVELCEEVASTAHTLPDDTEYRKDGYLVLAIDDTERQEIIESIEIIEKFGFKNQFIKAQTLCEMGFSNVLGARFEADSAQAHPVKFRNALLKKACSQGLRYCQPTEILGVNDIGGRIHVETAQRVIPWDAAVLATNAYSPLLSPYFASHRLVEPFRGQIICSHPLKSKLPVTYPHSFDHGYEYAIATSDNRLMLGGWRNHTKEGELGTYELSPNPVVEEGLKNFAKFHYKVDEDINWKYSWSGIMASSKTGFPFIGPTNSPLIYTVSGFTGHGFSWAHGSAKLLAKIMSGREIPAVAKFFDPRPLK